MTKDMLEAVVAAANASFDKKGTAQLPERTTVTLHVAHDGAALAVTRVVGLSLQGELLRAEVDKGDAFFLALGDVFAATVAGPDQGSTRKAGFLR